MAQVDQQGWLKYRWTFCVVPPRHLEALWNCGEKVLDMGPEALDLTWVLPLALPL